MARWLRPTILLHEKVTRLKMMRIGLLTINALLGLSFAASLAHAAEYFMYVGTYTNLQSKGIYAFRFDSTTGKLSPLGLAVKTPSPSYLALHPNGRFLYAVNEISHFQRMTANGSVSAFSIDSSTGMLKLMNAQASQGDGPCHLALGSQGKCVIVANYNNGSISAFPISDDGFLKQSSAFFQHLGSSVNPKNQKSPHAHCVAVSPDNRFALVADLGLDQVLVYHLNAADGTMSVNEPRYAKVAPGSGPRHLAFHPNGKFVYSINEIASTITTFAYAAQAGTLSELQTVSTIPKDFKEHNDTAELQVHPSGKFLYGSNRGHDSIAVFAIDPAAGTLKPIEHVPTQGKTPRGFSIDPTGAFLIAGNQQSNTIAVFKIDRATGRLTLTGPPITSMSPVSFVFAPAK